MFYLGFDASLKTAALLMWKENLIIIYVAKHEANEQSGVFFQWKFGFEFFFFFP